MFVIDAATLFCQRSLSGQLFALQQLDGATIKRVIDDWGRTPQPYRDPLLSSPAGGGGKGGGSPVQQVLMTVNIALRRQLWQLDYFSEGSIPDALIGVPSGWTPELPWLKRGKRGWRS